MNAHQSIQVETWEALEERLSALRPAHESPGGYQTPLLYRGQANASWSLDTTLERFNPKCIDMPFIDYYRVIHAIKPAVETFTDTKWTLKSYKDIIELFSNYDQGSLALSMGKLPAYNYMVYLRHNGFPSPLLDWTRSPFVAAYFAFSELKASEYVSIYVYDERPHNMKVGSSNLSNIHRFGPNIRTHRRHHLQQSEYTICAEGLPGWRFTPHQTVFERQNPKQDVLTKFDIPITERSKVLELLDRYNLNAFSLFGSEESLMHTMATRYLSGL